MSFDKFREWVQENHERQPTLGSELAAMGREALKDLRATLVEAYSGQAEKPGELGSPLNVVQREIYDERHQKPEKTLDIDMGI